MPTTRKTIDLSATVAETVRSAVPTGTLAALPEPRHPAGAGMTREVRRDIYNLDPRRIEVHGFYVREPEDEEDFEAFCETLRERGQVDIPLSVRSAGSSGPLAPRHYVLVWGRRRLAAALRLGLPQVPVRDFGEISETEAIKLQLQENLNRRAMTPVETAHAFHELTTRGVTNREIARTYGKTESYVSYMVRTGEALAQLGRSERSALNRGGVLRVRDCQEIAKEEELGRRVAALRSLAVARPAESDAEASGTPVGSVGKGRGVRRMHRRPDEASAFVVRELRHGRGRSFRVRWSNEDLVANPEGFVARLAAVLRSELDHVIQRLDELTAARAAQAAPVVMADQRAAEGDELADAFQRAREAALGHAAWLTADRAPEHEPRA